MWMERTRATWTNERLDDLSRRVDDGFNRVDLRFDSIDRRFEALDRRIDAFQALILQLGGGMIVAILATLLSVLLTSG